MSITGPIPSRSDQRVRRNKPDVPIDKIESIGTVIAPDLGLPNPHPLVTSLYESLSDSAQSRFYEPSDYEFARITLFFLDDLLKSEKKSAMMLASVSSMLTSLLLTEGDRRRVRIEVERNQTAGVVLDVADMFRQRLERG